MREQIVKEINGDNYEFYQLPIGESIRILLVLLKVMGYSIGKTIGSLKSGGDSLTDTDISFPALGDALASFTERLNEKELKDVIDTILKYTHIESEDGKFIKIQKDIHFSGKLQDLFIVVYHGLDVNFSDFVETIKKKVQPLKGLIAKKMVDLKK